MSKTDMLDAFPAVHDQAGIHSCMAFAVCDAVWWECVQRDSGSRGRVFVPSALFLYYNARRRSGQERRNIALTPLDTMAALGELGVCPEELWPYRPERYLQQPPAEAYITATSHAGIEFERLRQEEAALKSSLDEGRPFLVCLRLFRSNCWEFHYGATHKNGRMVIPGDEEYPILNHAMLAVGYDESTAQFRLRNSFGGEWGDNGHVYVPDSYLLDPRKAYAFSRVKRTSSIACEDALSVPC